MKTPMYRANLAQLEAAMPEYIETVRGAVGVIELAEARLELTNLRTRIANKAERVAAADADDEDARLRRHRRGRSN